MNSAYELYGHTLHTAEPMPWLLPATMPGLADIFLNRAEVSLLPHVDQDNPFLQTTESGELLYCSQTMGRFLLCGGNEIRVASAVASSAGRFQSLLTGTLFAGVAAQRNLVALHANAILWEERTILICGPACAGKSALAAACIQFGAQLVADDLCLLAPRNEGAITVLPGPQRIRLWQDTFNLVGWPQHEAEQISTRHKLALPVKTATQLSPVTMVVRLDPRQHALATAIAPLIGAAAIMPLDSLLWWQPHAASLDRQLRAINLLEALARQAQFVRLTFRQSKAQLFEAAGKILEHAGKLP